MPIGTSSRIGYIPGMRIEPFSSGGMAVGMLLAVSLAFAVPGAKRYVASKVAFVRAEPYGAAAKVATLREGTAVVEITRQGNWLQVGVVGEGITGWIHLSFLEQRGVAHERTRLLIPAMRRFRPAFDTFNAIKTTAAEPPFLEARDRGNGVLLVIATAAWWSNPLARKRDDLMSVYQIWKVANEHLPVTVFIRDTKGKLELKHTDVGSLDHGP